MPLQTIFEVSSHLIKMKFFGHYNRNLTLFTKETSYQMPSKELLVSTMLIQIKYADGRIHEQDWMRRKVSIS